MDTVSDENIRWRCLKKRHANVPRSKYFAPAKEAGKSEGSDGKAQGSKGLTPPVVPDEPN